MKKEDIIDEGIIGNPSGFIETKSDDFKMLQQAILKDASKQTPQQKIEIFLFGLKLHIEDYLQDNKPKNILSVGYFLKQIIDEMNIKNNMFAEYIDLTKTNLSALIHGRRKLNAELAYKLEAIFNISAELWIGIEYKNDLLKLRKEAKNKYKKYKLQDLISA